MATQDRPRRPPALIESITIANILDEENQWMPLTIVKGSWILLQSTKRKRRSSNEFLASWKGRVKDFKLKENNKVVKEVLVQHVYMHKELTLTEWPQNLPIHRPNCKFLQFLVYYFWNFKISKNFCSIHIFSQNLIQKLICSFQMFIPLHMKNGSLWRV